jgi:2'-5' RNA ligase
MAGPADSTAAGSGGTTPATLRVFFALWPDTEARERIAVAARDVARRGGGRATPAANHHMTLAFVGEAAPARIPALETVGEIGARSVSPFTLVLDRLGEFRQTRIRWLGCDVVPVELNRLVVVLRNALAADNFPVERHRFHAHVTLARNCGRVAGVTIAPVAWRAEFLTLTASELRPEGSLYRELARWPLGASQ